MLSQDFEIYYYSDTGHNNVDLHAHDYYEFYFYMEGDVEFEIGDSRQALKSGDFVIVPPGIRHRAFVVDPDLPYRRFVFWIGTDFAQQLADRFPDFGCDNRNEQHGKRSARAALGVCRPADRRE
jgi:glyoxylate utilization-related uncharacterized protein